MKVFEISTFASHRDCLDSHQKTFLGREPLAGNAQLVQSSEPAAASKRGLEFYFCWTCAILQRVRYILRCLHSISAVHQWPPFLRGKSRASKPFLLTPKTTPCGHYRREALRIACMHGRTCIRTLVYGEQFANLEWMRMLSLINVLGAFVCFVLAGILYRCCGRAGFHAGTRGSSLVQVTELQECRVNQQMRNKSVASRFATGRFRPFDPA